jgi:ABC-type branched-subunit amino acid transport system substrate-binding protein
LPDLPTLKEVAGWENCENLYFEPWPTELTPEQKGFEEEYKRRFGEENWAGIGTLLVYDQPYWILQGIVGAQSFDTTKILEYLETHDIKSIFGEPAWLGGQGSFGVKRVPMWPIHIAKVKNGKIVPVGTRLQDRSL